MRTPTFSVASVTRRSYSTGAGKTPLLITPTQLKALPQGTTVPLDVSWHMPNSNRSALAEYLSGPRIPNARRFDLDEVAELDPAKNPLSLTHMLPSAETFQAAVQKLGITPESHVVLYDTIGVFSSPRGLFTFKAFGHEKVSILDGGLPRWVHEGNEVEVGEVKEVEPSDYALPEGPNPEFVRTSNNELIVAYEQIVENSKLKPEEKEQELVLDHRPRARWEGAAPEPRPGLSSGHIPNSLPAPFLDYLAPPSEDKPYTSYKSPTELKHVLVNAVGGKEVWDEMVKGNKNAVFTCGSGMTAAVGWLANEVVRPEEGSQVKTSIYDESWTGYASREESKIWKEDK